MKKDKKTKSIIVNYKTISELNDFFSKDNHQVFETIVDSINAGVDANSQLVTPFIIKKTNSIDITFESLFLFKFNFIAITSTTLTNIAMVSNISSTFFLLILYFLYTLLYIYPQFQATQTLSSLNMKLYNHI